MAKIYIAKILQGKITLLNVPARWHDAVKTILDEIYENGEITLEEYMKYVGEGSEESSIS